MVLNLCQRRIAQAPRKVGSYGLVWHLEGVQECQPNTGTAAHTRATKSKSRFRKIAKQIIKFQSPAAELKGFRSFDLVIGRIE